MGTIPPDRLAGLIIAKSDNIMPLDNFLIADKVSGFRTEVGRLGLV